MTTAPTSFAMISNHVSSFPTSSPYVFNRYRVRRQWPIRFAVCLAYRMHRALLPIKCYGVCGSFKMFRFVQIECCLQIAATVVRVRIEALNECPFEARWKRFVSAEPFDFYHAWHYLIGSP